ncbi:hypothetical protein WwAna0676, partial [Wolbachia endosymbiont of Drosophila ananassae]
MLCGEYSAVKMCRIPNLVNIASNSFA